MELLPDPLLWEILIRLDNTVDRNSISLTAKRFHKLDSEQRGSLKIGCGLNPANASLQTLCHRFPNLDKLEITYSGWMSKQGKQLDDSGLSILCQFCPHLTDLSLSYCTFITDIGLRQLASCTKLSSLKLKFIHRVTECGLLSLIAGCRGLTVLHLIRCMNIRSFKWVEYLGKMETIEELMIKNCRGIGEGDLKSLQKSWTKLRRFHFEVDSSYRRYMKVFDELGAENWQKHLYPCENMVDLCLAKCIISAGRGMACLLSQCRNLERVQLDMCLQLRDRDIIGLAQNSPKLRLISLCSPSMDYFNPPRLTDKSLNALAVNCSSLESLRISFSDGEFLSPSLFSLEGIVSVVRSCPIRELSLDRVYLFNDLGMQALLNDAHWLERLDLERCQEVSDDGLMLAAQIPKLRVLRLCKCLGVSDDGLIPLTMKQLEVLDVEDCPMVSETGCCGAAKSVLFKQDLSWMH